MEQSQNEKLYDRVAEGWKFLLGEDLHWGYFLDPRESLADATKALVWRLAEWSKLEAGLLVLDVGCGRGEAACALAERYRCVVTGIAPSRVCISIAAAKAAQRGVAELARFSRRDGTRNGFPDGSFDRVWAMESSHLMDKEKLISESVRVLRGGGRFALCDMVLRRGPTAREAKEIGKTSALTARVFGATRLARMEEYCRLLRDNQMRIIGVEDVTQQALPSLAKWRENATQHRARVTRMIGSDYADDFIACLDAIEALWATGLYGYGIIVADRGSGGSAA